MLILLQIPQLQAHCKKLTEAGRTSTCRRFLNAVNQFTSSISLWACNDGTSVNLSDAQMAAEARYLKSKLAELEKSLENAVQACLQEVKESLSENIYDKFDQVIKAAVNEANTTAAKWGAPINRENRAAGGLHWGTYKLVQVSFATKMNTDTFTEQCVVETEFTAMRKDCWTSTCSCK